MVDKGKNKKPLVHRPERDVPQDPAQNPSRDQSHDSLEYARSIGYSEQEVRSMPEGAAMVHGCGNPTALAGLKKGDTVLDLGCGAGFDALLAAQRVGPDGKVIGIDRSAEAIGKATAYAGRGNYTNVEFRVAEIEPLPVPDRSVDVIISNCVINDSPDKPAVFREARRVLKDGGRVLVSDLVTVGKLDANIPCKAGKLWAQWLHVACERAEYLNSIRAAGFTTVTVLAEGLFPMAEASDLLRGKIISIQVEAR
jgi:arsenite methyltransferase